MANLSAMYPTHPRSVSLNLKIKDLVDFFGKYFFGDPLCIRLDSEQFKDLNVRIEFSQQLATIFIQYVMEQGMPVV
jgi:hypothetical protein